MGPNCTLQLAYAFIPSSNPIRASKPESNPNIIDLQVMISNPTLEEIKFKMIQIEVPVGDDIAADLSSEPKLPDPVYDTGGQWKIAIDPTQTDTILVSPKNPGQAVQGDAIIFKLPGIRVNTKPGTVVITVDEDGVEDSGTYSLLKQTSDFPVIKFWADPAILSDLDLPSKLYWNCDPVLGPQYTYNLHELDGSWNSPNHQWNEGATGITTSKLTQTTTKFALEVVKSDSLGHPTIVGTVYTRVSVDEPEIVKAYMEPTVVNHIYCLHWLTRNTTKCDLWLDDKPFLSDLPLDTYHQGYQVYPVGNEGPHRFTLVAYGKSEETKDIHSFPDFQIKSESITLRNIDLNINNVVDFIVTKDGTLAILGTYDNSIYFIDLAKRSQLDSMQLTVEDLNHIAITPDDKFVLITAFEPVTVIDIHAHSVVNTIQRKNFNAIAFTPDGRHALAAITGSFAIAIIDIPNWSVETEFIGIDDVENPIVIAVTPDGKLALVADYANGQVTVIDINNRSVEPAQIPVGNSPRQIAITPDNTLALVVNYNSITVINIAERSVEAAIPAINGAFGNIAITTDSRYALIGNYNDSSISLIDISRRSVISSLSVDSRPLAIALTPDNTVIVLKESNRVEFID